MWRFGRGVVGMVSISVSRNDLLPVFELFDKMGSEPVIATGNGELKFAGLDGSRAMYADYTVQCESCSDGLVVGVGSVKKVKNFLSRLSKKASVDIEVSREALVFRSGRRRMKIDAVAPSVTTDYIVGVPALFEQYSNGAYTVEFVSAEYVKPVFDIADDYESVLFSLGSDRVTVAGSGVGVEDEYVVDAEVAVISVPSGFEPYSIRFGSLYLTAVKPLAGKVASKWFFLSDKPLYILAGNARILVSPQVD